MYYGIRFEHNNQGPFFEPNVFNKLEKAAKKVARLSDDMLPATFLTYYIANAPSPYDQYRGIDYQYFDTMKFAFTSMDVAYKLFGLEQGPYFEQLEHLLKSGLLQAKLYEIPLATYSEDYAELIFPRSTPDVKVVRTTHCLEELFEWEMPKSFC